MMNSVQEFGIMESNVRVILFVLCAVAITVYLAVIAWEDYL